MTDRALNRERMARKRAKSLDLRVVRRAGLFELRGADGAVLCDTLDVVEVYLGERYIAKAPGPAEFTAPPQWNEMIADYCLYAAAAGHTAQTIATRRKALIRLGRELDRAPGEVTADEIIAWFGRQQWKPETRRQYRASARGFFRWAYSAGRVPHYLCDALPVVRQPPVVPRPVPDDTWRAALAAASPRVALMMRLAAEVGLRRAEVAQVRTDDVLEGLGGAQLVVRGKGGRVRVLPISDRLADSLRAGAAGHTRGAPVAGWLFPTGHNDEHLTAPHVGKLVAATLPPGWSMHKLRHRFATRAHKLGGRNLRAVQTLLGHTSVATTQRYIAVDDDEIRAAMMAAADQDDGTG